MNNQKEMEMMFAVLVAALLILMFLLTGCGIVPLSAFAGNKNPTPDEIKAYRESDMDVYGCVVLIGPPPAGKTIWIIVPRGTPNVTLPPCGQQL